MNMKSKETNEKNGLRKVRNDGTLKEILEMSKMLEGNKRNLKLVRAHEFGNMSNHSIYRNFKMFEKHFGILHNVGGKGRKEIEITNKLLEKFDDI